MDSKDIKALVMAKKIAGGSGGGTYQEKAITPDFSGADSVVVRSDSGYDALSSVTINKHENLVAGNIKNGVTINGVSGSFAGESVKATLVGSIEGTLATALNNQSIQITEAGTYLLLMLATSYNAINPSSTNFVLVSGITPLRGNRTQWAEAIVYSFGSEDVPINIQAARFPGGQLPAVMMVFKLDLPFTPSATVYAASDGSSDSFLYNTLPTNPNIEALAVFCAATANTSSATLISNMSYNRDAQNKNLSSATILEGRTAQNHGYYSVRIGKLGDLANISYKAANNLPMGLFIFS